MFKEYCLFFDMCGNSPKCGCRKKNEAWPHLFATTEVPHHFCPLSHATQVASNGLLMLPGWKPVADVFQSSSIESLDIVSLM